MPQRPVDDYWKERVKSLLGADPGREPGPRAIKRQLDFEAERMDKSDLVEVGYPPSERSITRIRDQEWQPLSEEKRREYRELHWPESMERHDLPWESSATALELLDLSDRYKLARPPAGLARWFWRVTQAMPEADALRRLVVALTVAAHREAGRPLPESPLNNPFAGYNGSKLPLAGPAGYWAAALVQSTGRALHLEMSPELADAPIQERLETIEETAREIQNQGRNNS